MRGMAEKEYIERTDLIKRFKLRTKSWERDYGIDAPAMVRVYQDFLCTLMGLRAADIVSREAYESAKRDAVRAFEEGQEFIRIADSYAQRNKELEIELDALRGAANSLKMHLEKAKAEVEEWKARANDWQNQYLKLIDENEIYQEHVDQDIIYTKAIRAEAIKELLERAEERVTYFEDECGAFMPFIDCRDLEAIAEELSEEDAG